MADTDLLDFIGIRYYDTELKGYLSTTYATKTELQAVDQKASTAFHFKGTVANVADLPSSGNQQGDVYNVTNAGGTNYAWTGSAWDELGSDWSTLVHNTGDETIGGTKTFTNEIQGSISGNAGTADKLKTARALTTKLDSTTAVTFDGSDFSGQTAAFSGEADGDFSAFDFSQHDIIFS